MIQVDFPKWENSRDLQHVFHNWVLKFVLIENVVDKVQTVFLFTWDHYEHSDIVETYTMWTDNTEFIWAGFVGQRESDTEWWSRSCKGRYWKDKPQNGQAELIQRIRRSAIEKLESLR